MLRPWHYHIELEIDSSVTIHQQLVNHFQMLIRQGSWLSGSALPSTRDLAKNLGINRKTAAKVYDELLAQGWIYTEPKRGTFVADSLPVASTETSTTTKPHTATESQPQSEHALKITQLLQKEMVKLTRRAALYMHKIGYAKKEIGSADAGGLISLRTLIAQLLIHELGLNTNPTNILCHHSETILYQVFIKELKKRGDYLLIDEACPIQDKYTLRDHGFILLEVPSQNDDAKAHDFSSTSNRLPSNKLADKTLTRTLNLDIIEKYCINYPVAALWVTANAENALGQGVAINPQIKSRLHQFNVLLIEDHRHQFISSKPHVSGKYQTDNTVILGSLYAQRHSYVDIHYVALPHELAMQVNQYLTAYIEPQSLLNAQIQYEFIKCGYYKKLCLAWENLLEQRYKKISALLQAHSTANTYKTSNNALLNVKAITEKAIYLHQSKNNKHGLNADLDSLGIHLDNLYVEYVDDQTSRLNYEQLDEATFTKLYVGLEGALKNTYVQKEFLLKTG